jgi:hypothetical protein
MDNLFRLGLILFISVVAVTCGTFVGYQVKKYDKERQVTVPAYRPTYQELTEEANRTVGTPCAGSANQLSPRQQIMRVNEILGTPTQQKEGRP